MLTNDVHVKLNNEGTCAFKAGDFKNALEKFSKGLSTLCEPETHSMLLSNRSSTYLKLKQFENAIKDARECVQVRPDWPKSYIRLGKALESNGDVSEAAVLVLQGISRSQEHRNALTPVLEELNNKHRLYDSGFMDCVRMRGKKYCHFCKKQDDKLSVCAQCKVVFYCSKTHQKEHWAEHKKICKKLGQSHRQNEAMNKMVMSPDLPFFTIKKKPYPPLNTFNSWQQVWEYLACCACKDEIFRKRMADSLSWPLTLINGLCQFGLEGKEKLLVHILGAEDYYVNNGRESYFSDLLPCFPMPNTKIVLIGPELTSQQPVQKIPCVNGKNLYLSSAISTWHGYMNNNECQPDLIVACHPGIQNYHYQWMPTLQKIITESIPCVFTSWDLRDFQDMIDILKEMLKVNIKFQGKSPIASPVMFHDLRKWNEYMIKTMNSYWVGFQGST